MKHIYVAYYRYTFVFALALITLIATSSAQDNIGDNYIKIIHVPEIAQAFSPTPIPANIPRNTPLPVINTVSTPTFTPTATQQQFVTLSVRSDIQDSVNVRAEPDPESTIVGVINVGDSYPVTGQYFLWFRLRFDESPSGQAWVFSDLVTVTGDLGLVPDLSTEPEATTDPTIVGATQTWQVITLTPGGVLTVTASSRLLNDPINVDENTSSINAGINSNLPTFTPPANSNFMGNTDSMLEQLNRSGSSSQNSLPPILPIVILGGLGLFGFVVSMIRK